MRILFLHQNFPAQFLHVARELHGIAGNDVCAITDAANLRPDLVPTRRYRFDARSIGINHPLAAHFASRVARGEIVAREMLALRQDGFVPDVVVGHPGWGETLFAKDVWPDTRLVVHAEFYYRTTGGDMDFDAEFSSASFETRARTRVKNAAMLAALADAEFGIAPTQWQGDSFPREMKRKIAIIHEGVDTALVCPDPAARVELENGLSFGAGDEVITFVNRNLEPYRGYHVFMRALPDILAARPKAHAIIVGGDGVSYGPGPPAGTTWARHFLDEVRDRLPPGRVHFLGKIPYPAFIDLMRISAAHVYLTYPFVLSWSMLEAMSAGALVIASRTAPVREVIEHERNGLLVDFFDRERLAQLVVDTLADRRQHDRLRQNARATIIERYDLRRKCLPQWRSFVETVAGRSS
jgi:glycosyltransferase involved in cell wall biosynthesis